MDKIEHNKMCTDTFSFQKQQFFIDLIKTLPADKKNHTQNILEYKDDIIFAWDSNDCTVLSFNWKLARAKSNENIKYQTLIPSTPQNYTVEKLTVSNEGMFLALSGARGVSIFELPRRWNTNGLYKNGQEKLICNSYNLDERYFTNNPHLEVLQVRWHPISPKDSLLIVLLSNNFLRVYDDCKLSHVWRIGAIPYAVPSTGSNLPYLNSLGDTAVDFDIAPPRVVSSTAAAASVEPVTSSSLVSVTSPNNNNNNNKSLSLNQSLSQLQLNDSNRGNDKVEWPLLILRGNGSIYVLLIGINTKKPRIEGPIKMYPSVSDNYGVDSCSILVLQSVPPTIVIAESNGKLHHGLFIESKDVSGQKEITTSNLIDSSLVIYQSEWIIQILETVELELGLQETKVENDVKLYSCPIYLKRDIINDSRYFAYHNTGLHGITINFIRELEDFLNSDSKVLDPPSFSNPSHAEYLVCTKALDCNKLNVILGFVLLQNPSGLLLILGSGQIVSLDVITDPGIFRNKTINPSENTSSAVTEEHSSLVELPKIFNQCFESHIKNILTSDVQQPLLKLTNVSEPTLKDSLELLLHATQILREKHFFKHVQAHQEIQKRVKQLQILKQQQFAEIAQLQIEKKYIREKAEKLAELYEDIAEKQVVLVKRAQEIVRLATIHLPQTSLIEKDFEMQIEKLNAITKVLCENILLAKRRIQSQEIQINKQQQQQKSKETILQPKQKRIIKEVLADVTKEIEEQINDVKRCNNILNLS